MNCLHLKYVALIMMFVVGRIIKQSGEGTRKSKYRMS
jgi:hypothetical protein